MSNMGYCKFENTLRDLKDCEDTIGDKSESESEEKARKRLIELCKQIADEQAERQGENKL